MHLSRKAPIPLTERGKIKSRKAQIEFAPEGGKSNPASTASPHYSFGKLNASMQIACQRAATLKTPNERREKNSKKTEKDIHNRYMQIRLTQEEYEAIDRKFQNSGLKSRSEFIRTLIFEGIIVHISEDELRKIYRLVSNIAGNINQIAVRVNSTGNVYAEDIAEIKEGLQKIWQPLRYFQSQLQKLKH